MYMHDYHSLVKKKFTSKVSKSLISKLINNNLVTDKFRNL